MSGKQVLYVHGLVVVKSWLSASSLLLPTTWRENYFLLARKSSKWHARARGGIGEEKRVRRAK